MKQYDVKISRAALSDMEQIYSYIADRLLEPDTAMGQYNRIAEAIQSLNILPERCALVKSEPERTQGLHEKYSRHTASSVLFSELCECACSIHGITVLNLLDAHLQGGMKLVIGHGVSVQSRRSLRKG